MKTLTLALALSASALAFSAPPAVARDPIGDPTANFCPPGTYWSFEEFRCVSGPQTPPGP